MSTNTWITGVITLADTTYGNSYRYRSKICYGCGEGSVDTGCTIIYDIPQNVARHDWAYQEQTPCMASTATQWVQCLDYRVCPNIGGIQAQAQWADNNDSVTNPWSTSFGSINNSSENSTNIACVYPQAAFLSLDAVEQFSNTFPTQINDPNSDFNTKILPFFCLSQSNNCPQDPYTGLPMSGCSRFVSLGDDGTLCRGWVNTLPQDDPVEEPDETEDLICSQPVPSQKDLTYYQYCGHYNTPDCLCINRADNPIYQAMAIGLSGTSNDRCWWIPCQDSTKYLIPTDLPCCDPTQNTIICNNLNLVLGGESENLTFNPQSYTSCGVDPDDNGGGGNGGDSIEDTIWSRYWWLIILIIVVVIVAVILILFLI